MGSAASVSATSRSSLTRPLLKRPGLKIAWLASFIAGVTHGHLSSAAAALALSSQALKRNLDQLERHLGLQLIHYHSRGLQLTPEGKALFPEVKALLSALSCLQQGTDSALQVQRSLRIGWQDHWLQHGLESFICLLRSSFPSQQLSLQTYRDSCRLEQDLLRGKLELSILAQPPADNGIAWVRGHASPFVMAAASPFSAAFESLSCARAEGLPSEAPQNATPRRISTDNLQGLLDLAGSGFCAVYLPTCLMQDPLASGQLSTYSPPTDQWLWPHLCWTKTSPPEGLEQILSDFEAAIIPAAQASLPAGDRR